ncbi:MAG: glycosyltransferase family 2 protein [Stellaceae bacterium]
MLITVAICTLNRAESLRRTLESLAAMRVPEELDWELLVVNNDCTDHTDDVINGLADRLPVRREFEAQRGHSRARNRAVEVMKGDYIVWTDDDVVVDPGWLEAYAEAFFRWPQAAVFGGRIIPRYEMPAARWMVENETLLFGALAIRDFGDDFLPLSVADGRVPFGANFALRAAEQRRFRYNPELGLGPVRRRLGDEADVIERIMQSGGIGYWVPTARVEHCIGRGRQTIGYVARYYAGYGETAAFRDPYSTNWRRFWFGVPPWLWRRLVSQWMRYQIHRRISPAPVWVAYLQAYALAWGAIRYWRNERG